MSCKLVAGNRIIDYENLTDSHYYYLLIFCVSVYIIVYVCLFIEEIKGVLFDLWLSITGDNESQPARIHVIDGQEEVHGQPQGEHCQLISGLMEGIGYCFINFECIISLGIWEVLQKKSLDDKIFKTH